jgi:leucyl-tRNA synthetase
VDPATDRAVAHLISETTEHMEGLRFNVAVARCMELTNLLRKAHDAGHDVRASVASLVTMIAPFAPYTADEAWERLGGDGLATRQPWPTVDPTLLVMSSVVCAVQVEGKVRARLDVDPAVGDEELRARALADPAVIRALAGRAVRTVVIRAPKLVNIVTA